MRRISLECRKGEYALVVRIPIEVQFEKGSIVVKERDALTCMTIREQQVLEGICKFKQNKEIAQELNLSERTVKFHVSSLLTKAGVNGRSQLALLYHKTEGATQ